MVRRRPVLSAVLSAVAGILILASGCADQGPTAVQLQPAKALSAAKAYSGGTYSASIGADGGILKLPVGRIIFPAGAVAGDTRISAELDGKHIAATFGPEGLVFPVGKEPKLEFDVAGLRVEIATLQILYVDASDGILEFLPTTFQDGRVSGELRHFSKYVLAEAEP
jgi:hypothetical protein